MLRWHVLASIGVALSVLCPQPAAGQERSPAASRLLRSVPLEKTAADDESSKATAPLRVQPRKKVEKERAERKGAPRHDLAATLAEFRVKAPYDLSNTGRYLVAAEQDESGLVLCDVTNRRRLRKLGDSGRRYALVEISPDARWIAAVRQDDSDRIDLWRADNGRHIGTLDAPGGGKQKLEFSAAGDELRVVGRGGHRVAFRIPSGELLGGSDSAKGGAAARPYRVEVPRIPPSVGAAPSAPRATVRSEPRKGDVGAPPALPPGVPKIDAPAAPDTTIESAPEIAAPIERRPIVRSAPKMVAPDFKPPTAASPPKESVPMPRAMMREPSGGAAPPRFGDVGSALPETAAEPAPPAPAEPTPRAATAPAPRAAESAAEPSFEPAAPEEAAESAPEEAVESAPPAAAPSEAGAEPPDESPPADGAAPGESRFEYRIEAEEEAPSQPAAREPEESAKRDEPTDRDESTASGESAESDPSTVTVNFATNRNRLAPKDRQWQVYFLGFFSSLPAFVIYGLMALALLILPWFGKRSWAALALGVGGVVLCSMGVLEAYVRSQLRDEMTGELYGSRPTDISYGTCEVSVPPPENRNPGELNRPVSVWIFEAPENPEKHFMLRKVSEHPNKDAFYASLGRQLDKTESRAALLFIHGYNVSFEDAVFRTAQLAVDLKFPGAPITFSWPSYADPVKYPFDEQNAEVSIPALREFLVDLAAKSGAERIHIIAHSMGNRVLAGAMEGMDEESRERNKNIFREVVLAAPDIDSRVFKSQVLPHIVANTEHCTLYASSRDRALLISRYFHNYQRLGETEPDLILANGMDTIDASLVDTSLLGHSYIGDAHSIVSDLHDLVVGGKQATERLGLESLRRGELLYWSIKPQFEAATDPSLRR